MIAALVALVLLTGPVPVLAERSDDWLPRIWPTEGTVVDGFRPPATKYGSGNRGLEFATGPDTPFVATADGVVSFAGQVGGRLFVTTRHVDGLAVTYSWVARIDVSKGERVIQGQVLGASSGTIHVGVRDGERYLDPAPIFGPREATPDTTPPVGTTPGRARLVAALVGPQRLSLLFGQASRMNRPVSLRPALLGVARSGRAPRSRAPPCLGPDEPARRRCAADPFPSKYPNQPW